MHKSRLEVLNELTQDIFKIMSSSIVDDTTSSQGSGIYNISRNNTNLSLSFTLSEQKYVVIGRILIIRQEVYFQMYQQQPDLTLLELNKLALLARPARDNVSSTVVYTDGTTHDLSVGINLFIDEFFNWYVEYENRIAKKFKKSGLPSVFSGLP